MANEVKVIEFVDYTYRFEEMIEDMKKAYANNLTALEKQSEVINDLKTLEGAAEKHKEFIETYETMIAQAKEKQKVLHDRIEKAEAILTLIKADTTDELTCVLSLLLECFGITNQEQKSVEERKENKEEVKVFRA